MDEINQVLCGHRLVILWNGNRSSNFKSLLNERRRNSNYPLNRNVAAFACIVQLSITSRCRKICIEVGVAQSPAWCQIKPGICWWEGDTMASSIISFIEQISIRDLNSL